MEKSPEALRLEGAVKSASGDYDAAWKAVRLAFPGKTVREVLKAFSPYKTLRKAMVAAPTVPSIAKAGAIIGREPAAAKLRASAKKPLALSQTRDAVQARARRARLKQEQAVAS